ncbi:MAG: hypothetical protein QOH66_2631 [Actinomycetota bacterium]|jgi:hypothetical protein|nr:hypothetical protein [Actinomycetota bacterium]MEA2589704.1 hypothetical protein [Actinomycetota bacterium]
MAAFGSSIGRRTNQDGRRLGLTPCRALRPGGFSASDTAILPDFERC